LYELAVHFIAAVFTKSGLGPINKTARGRR